MRTGGIGNAQCRTQVSITLTNHGQQARESDHYKNLSKPRIQNKYIKKGK